MPPRHDMDIRLDVDPSAPPHPSREREPLVRSVLLLADFSGRAPATGPSGPLRARRVDRDSVDSVLAEVGPVLDLGAGDRVVFGSLEDFHPDALFDRVGVLGAVLDGREGGDGAGSGGGEPARPGETPAARGPVGDERGASRSGSTGADGLLDRILDEVAGPERAEARRPEAGPADSVRAFAAEASRRDAVAPPDPTEEAARGARERRAAQALRAFLRLPGFRELERRWRSVDFAARRLDTGPELHLYLADVSRTALAAEAEGPGGVEASALAALLGAGAGPEGRPWSTVVLLDGTIGPDPADQLLLAWVTGLCGAWGATLLVEAEPSLAGIGALSDFDDPTAWQGVDPGWTAFRRQPEARSVGAAVPGFLLRAPYGADTDPIDSVPFEEVEDRPRHDDYLWGSGALAAVVALTREESEGRRLPRADLSLGPLPLHAWRAGVDSGTTCGAAAMTDAAARRLLEAGLIPVAWSRGSDRVRLLVPRTAGGSPLI